MHESLGYVLRAKPYSESGWVVDLWTLSAGRVRCFARPAKQRGKVQKGHLQSFLLLRLNWHTRVEPGRLTQTDECRRHRIPANRLIYGIYLNELLLRLLQTELELPELFSAYQHALQQLVQPEVDAVMVSMQFELALLEALGHHLNLWKDDVDGDAISASDNYGYAIGSGLIPENKQWAGPVWLPIEGVVLHWLREPQWLPDELLSAKLRLFLDRLWGQLSNKPLNSRSLLPH